MTDPGSSRKPWYELGISVALITGAFVIIGHLIAGVIPILSTDTGDFSISVNPVPIEAKPLREEIIPENIEDIFKISLKPENEQAVVMVQDVNRFTKNYIHPIYLRVVDNYNLSIIFANPAKEPPFEAKMFVYIKDINKSLDHVPLTIQGIGGNGRVRNCTVPVIYTSPKDLVKYAFIQYQIGRPNQSIELLDKALEIDPNYGLAWRANGIILGEVFGKMNEAFYCINQSLKLDPLNYESWFLKGLYLRKFGSLNESLIAYNTSLNINPNYTFAWNNKGVVLEQMNRDSEALIAYNKCIELNASYAPAWFGKSEVFARQGKYLEASDALIRVAKLNPDLAREGIETFGKVGDGLLAQGNYKEAIEMYNKVIELNPESSGRALKAKGDCLYALENYEDAIKMYEKVIELEPKLAASALISMGNAFYMQGMSEKANQSYAEAIKLDSNYALIRLRSEGYRWYLDHKYEEALRYFDKALEINPKDNATLELIDEVLREQQGYREYEDSSYIKSDTNPSMRTTTNSSAKNEVRRSGMNVILIGPPGSGKGTQAKMISDKYKVKHISTGDILRMNVRNRTPLGEEAKKYMDAGELVPDSLLIKIIEDRLIREDVKGGWMLDGYPRTIPQAEALDKILPALDQKIDVVLNIDVPDEELVKRVTGRRMCKCGATYHVTFNKPKAEGKCDACGGELYQRADDTEETVKQRLNAYHAQTQPLIDYYNKKGILANVVGIGDINIIFNNIVSALDKF